MSVWKPHILKVFFSGRYCYAQILHKAHPKDGGHYVASASTIQKDVRESLRERGLSTSDTAASSLVGKLLAQKAKQINLSEVHIDMKQLRYQGKLKAMIEAMREHGLQVK